MEAHPPSGIGDSLSEMDDCDLHLTPDTNAPHSIDPTKTPKVNQFSHTETKSGPVSAWSRGPPPRLPSSHKKDSRAPAYKIGIYLFPDRFAGSTEHLVWAESSFFRITDAPELKPLTPIAFTTSYQVANVVGKFRSQSYSGVFHAIADDNFAKNCVIPPVKGHFQAKDSEKISFLFNPDNLLRLPVRATLYKKHFPNISLETKMLVTFGVRPAKKGTINFPYITDVKKSSAESADEILKEPETDILPEDFLKDLYQNPEFNLLLGIGVPENPYFPVLDFGDFVELFLSKTFYWRAIYTHLLSKYKRRSEKEDEKGPNLRMYNMLLKHQSPDTPKGILLFPGRWSSFGPVEAEILAQDILKGSQSSVYTLRVANPFSNVETARESNPHLTGAPSGDLYSERYYITNPIGLGEVGLDQETHFDFSHNIKNFFLCKNKPANGPKPIFVGMFFPVKNIVLPTYKSPCVRETDSDVGENFRLFTSPKSAGDDYSTFAKVGLFSRPVPDPDRIWSNYSLSQFYSPCKDLNTFTPHLSLLEIGGRANCDSTFVATPCLPENRCRIVKLGKVRIISALQHRAAPIITLQKLKLIDQILPLSNFYFKVRMRDGVTDDQLVDALKQINNNLKVDLFHSLFLGQITYPLSYIERHEDRTPHQTTVTLVLETPPITLKLEDVEEWAREHSLSGVQTSWGVGPKGSCIIIDYSRTHLSTVPTHFCLGKKLFKISSFPSLPPQFLKWNRIEVEPVQEILGECASTLSRHDLLPEALEQAILKVLDEDVDPEPVLSAHKPLSSLSAAAAAAPFSSSSSSPIQASSHVSLHRNAPPATIQSTQTSVTSTITATTPIPTAALSAPVVTTTTTIAPTTITGFSAATTATVTAVTTSTTTAATTITSSSTPYSSTDESVSTTPATRTTTAASPATTTPASSNATPASDTVSTTPAIHSSPSVVSTAPEPNDRTTENQRPKRPAADHIPPHHTDVADEDSSSDYQPSSQSQESPDRSKSPARTKKPQTKNKKQGPATRSSTSA